MGTLNIMLRILNLIPQIVVTIGDFKQKCDVARFVFLRNQGSMEAVF